MVSMTIIGLVVYVVSYKFITKTKSEDLKDPIGGLFRVVGMLVSLMLSLAFGEVIVKLVTVRNAIDREVVAIADTNKDLELFDLEKTREIRSLLIYYTQALIDDEWPALANDSLSQRVDAFERQISKAVMKLEATTPLQEHLWPLLAADVDLISDLRLTRLDNALVEPPIYIIVIIIGFVVTMACFGAFKPQTPVVALVTLYTLFIGLVLYLILTLSDPFQGIGVEPTSFEYLVKVLQGRMI